MFKRLFGRSKKIKFDEFLCIDSIETVDCDLCRYTDVHFRLHTEEEGNILSYDIPLRINHGLSPREVSNDIRKFADYLEHKLVVGEKCLS